MYKNIVPWISHSLMQVLTGYQMHQGFNSLWLSYM